MRQILIINLTRMGDLLQTTPLMAGIKSKYPGSRISLLVNSAFTEVCRGIPCIDDLIEFDMKGYLVRRMEGKHSLVENYRILEALVNSINNREYDLAVNVTHSSVSAVLVSLIRAKEVRGFTISSEGHRVIKHPWVRYFFNVIPNRNYNPFHIVDMYLKIGDVSPVTRGLVYDIFPDDEERADQILAREGIHNEVLVGLHLGASKDEKAWPVSSYAGLADMICKQLGVKIILFGTSSEALLASEFEKYAETRPVNLVGKTGVGDLASLLKKCSLFISNDTGPLHVATSAGTTVIDISLANVHFMETGPFGEGHYVLQSDLPCSPCGFDVQCNDRVCNSLITPDKVFEVVKAALDGAGDNIELSTEKMEQVQVYRSYFQEDGYLDYRPLIKRSLEVNVLYRLIYRQVLNTESGKIDSGTAGICERICKDIEELYLNESVRLCMEVISDDLDVLAHLVRLTEQALRHLRNLEQGVSRDIRDNKEIKNIWKKIEPLEDEINLIGDTHHCFKPLTLLFDYSREALEGDDLEILVKESIEIYEGLLIKGENMQAIMTGMKSVLNVQTENSKLAMTS